jgi:hypothetical protein
VSAALRQSVSAKETRACYRQTAASRIRVLDPCKDASILLTSFHFIHPTTVLRLTDFLYKHSLRVLAFRSSRVHALNITDWYWRRVRLAEATRH